MMKKTSEEAKDERRPAEEEEGRQQEVSPRAAAVRVRHTNERDEGGRKEGRKGLHDERQQKEGRKRSLGGREEVEDDGGDFVGEFGVEEVAGVEGAPGGAVGLGVEEFEEVGAVEEGALARAEEEEGGGVGRDGGKEGPVVAGGGGLGPVAEEGVASDAEEEVFDEVKERVQKAEVWSFLEFDSAFGKVRLRRERADCLEGKAV
mmetsp:Transcript_28136/g.86256  ORF Transcript_28136/g.86256 Transcript_28136/m.86256 type:complete len:204 (-) Transcript_28136:229-840(-)